jgi:hypothetical protein
VFTDRDLAETKPSQGIRDRNLIVPRDEYESATNGHAIGLAHDHPSERHNIGGRILSGQSSTIEHKDRYYNEQRQSRGRAPGNIRPTDPEVLNHASPMIGQSTASRFSTVWV